MTEPAIVERSRVVYRAALRAAPSLLAEAPSRREPGSALATNKSGLTAVALSGRRGGTNSVVDSLPNDSGRTTRRANNEMKPTKRWPGRASRLISVLSRREPPMTETTVAERRGTGRAASAAVNIGPNTLVAPAGSLRRMAFSGQRPRPMSLVDSLPNDSGRTKRRDNNALKPTSLTWHVGFGLRLNAVFDRL